MISRSSAEHYLWGQGCDGWHLVRSPALSVIYERMPPGAAEQRHAHRCARQFFFIVRGSAVFELAGAHYTLAAEQGIEVAPGTPHHIRNAGDGDVEFLVISQPPAQGDRVEPGEL